MSAEALMRSRYTAYALQRYEWLLESTHPDYREGISVEKLAEQGKDVTWLRLEMGSCANDVPAGNEGQRYDVVEFCAYYEIEGIPRQLGERSFFSHKDGRIYYVDGVPLRRQAYRRPEAKVGRNELCPCGSGRKYKKCCGVSGQI
ncbi:MAG: YchJ family metal-binding protein [Desulfovibrionaceae bacterium]|nr:YchJ family metal-binding protein [Desulfovibrionaceae bacterium]